MDTPRQNLLIITSHDLGQHLNCYGADSVVSPNLDRLAAEGALFEQYFSTAPTCSPSRACLWTGRYPHATGMLGLCHEFSLHEDETHLAQYFQEAGYRTALFGDQHVHVKGSARLGFQEEHPGKAAVNVPAKVAAAEFVAFLEAQAEGDPPFMADIGFFEPHRAFSHGGAEPCRDKGVTVPPLWADQPGAEQEFAEFQGAIRSLDNAMGTILEALDKSPFRDTTTVVFTVDHGIPFDRAKMTLYDPGLTTALIIREPRWGASGGKRITTMTSNVDLTPTILDGFGLEPKPNLHGRSMLGLLNGDPVEPRSHIFGTQTHHGNGLYMPMRCVRTEDWKYILNLAENPTYDLGHGAPPFAQTELYDLQADPQEQNNLAGSSAHADIQAELHQTLTTWRQDTEDPLLE